MGRPRSFSHEEARRLYQAGWTRAEIAERFSVSTKAIQNATSGLPRRRFDHDEARRLRVEGWSYNRIGRRLGVSMGAVWSAINRPKQKRPAPPRR
jgi:DNA-directed RNA polymerase specialized sigma24 family protein